MVVNIALALVLMQLDENNLEMRGALKSNHDSSKVRVSISFWCCARAIIGEHGVVE